MKLLQQPVPAQRPGTRSLAMRLGQGMAAKVLSLPVTALSTLSLTALIIHRSDARTYGFVMLIGSIFLVIPFADLGLGASVMNAVSIMHISRRDARNAYLLVSRVMKVLTVSGLTIVIISSLLSASGAWSLVLNIPLQGMRAWIPTLALTPFCISLPLGVGQRILVGLGRNSRATILASAGPVAAILLAGLLSLFDIDPLLFSVAPSFGVLVTSAVTFLAAKMYLGLRWQDFLLRRRGKVPLWGAAAPMLVISISVPLSIQLQRYFVSYMSPSGLAEYSIIAQLYLPCYSIISTAAIGLWPLFAASRSAAWPTWLKAMTMMGALGGAAFAGFVLFAPPIASLVSHGVIQVDLGIVTAFAALLFVMAIHQPSAMLLTTSRELWFQSGCALAMLASSLLISATASRSLGTPGPVWASTVAIFVFHFVTGAGFVFLTRRRRMT